MLHNIGCVCSDFGYQDVYKHVYAQEIILKYL